MDGVQELKAEIEDLHAEIKRLRSALDMERDLHQEFVLKHSELMYWSKVPVSPAQQSTSLIAYWREQAVDYYRQLEQFKSVCITVNNLLAGDSFPLLDSIEYAKTHLGKLPIPAPMKFDENGFQIVSKDHA